MGRLKLAGERERAKGPKQKYMLVNMVYASQLVGPLYVNLWLDNQLKSLLDKSNLPALREDYDLEYVLFTDEESLMQISRHPNFMALGALCEVTIIKMTWPPDADKFGSRYHLLQQVFKETMQQVFSKTDSKRHGAWCSLLVADLVFAKGALRKILRPLERGHDATLMVPIRGAADSMQPLLHNLPGAPEDMALFEMCYRNLHPLWTHATWNNPYFSKFPYSMIWHSNTGIVAHNFGITPIAFKPNEKMLDCPGVIDAMVPAFCNNPYWATDWLDAPVAGVEPLSNGHYPVFAIHQASEAGVTEWAQNGTISGQSAYLDKPLFYPSKRIFNNDGIAQHAERIALDIQDRCLAAQKEKERAMGKPND